MDAGPAFGRKLPGVAYRSRPAVYLITRNVENRLAVVRHRGRLFLPGGGIEPGESPEEALHREVREECGAGLEMGVRLGRAVQYFSLAEDHIRLDAVFYAGRLADPQDAGGEHDLLWVDSRTAGSGFYHECHAWAAQTLG